MGACGSQCGCGNEEGDFKTGEVALDDKHGKSGKTGGVMTAAQTNGNKSRQNGSGSYTQANVSTLSTIRKLQFEKPISDELEAQKSFTDVMKVQIINIRFDVHFDREIKVDQVH